MTLIVEDGTGTLAAESYASVTYADTYHNNRGNIDWETLETFQKEAALRKATDYLVQVYRQKWKGYKVLTTQYLDWPRKLVYLNSETVDSSTTALDYTVIPREIKNACVELALKSITDTLLLIDTEQQVVKETIGPLSTEYQPYANKYKQYTAIQAIIAPFLKSGSNKAIR